MEVTMIAWYWAVLIGLACLVFGAVGYFLLIVFSVGSYIAKKAEQNRPYLYGKKK